MEDGLSADTDPPGTPEPVAGQFPGLPRLFFPEPGADDSPGQQPPPRAPGESWPQSQPTPGQRPATPSRREWPPVLRPGGQRPGGQRPGSPFGGRSRSAQPPEREVRHRAIAALVFGMLAMLALLGVDPSLHRAIYLIVFSAIIGPTACVLGLTAMRKARQSGAYRPRGALEGVFLGAAAAAFAILVLALAVQ